MERNERLNEIEKNMLALVKERERLVAESESTSLMEDFMSKIDEFNVAKKKLMEEVQAKFSAVVGSIMRKSERFVTYTIRAYTPYFNDGDACNFRVSTWGDVNVDEEHEEDNGGWNEQDEKVEKEVRQFLEKVDDEIYKEVFGDHVQITFKRDGTANISKCEHD